MQTGSPTTARGHEEPFAVQFSIFLANRVGQLRELLDVFSEKDLAVVGISIVDSTDWGVIRMVLSDPNKAREVLRGCTAAFTESEVLLAELPTRDTLSEICRMLLQAELNIHFAYPLTLRSRGNPVMVLHVDDRVLAAQVLTRHQVVLLGDEDLADPA